MKKGALLFVFFVAGCGASVTSQKLAPGRHDVEVKGGSRTSPGEALTELHLAARNACNGDGFASYRLEDVMSADRTGFVTSSYRLANRNNVTAHQVTRPWFVAVAVCESHAGPIAGDR
jgi:hypothetical protein